MISTGLVGRVAAMVRNIIIVCYGFLAQYRRTVRHKSAQIMTNTGRSEAATTAAAAADSTVQI